MFQLDAQVGFLGSDLYSATNDMMRDHRLELLEPPLDVGRTATSSSMALNCTK
jgi:hypothetical protein